LPVFLRRNKTRIKSRKIERETEEAAKTAGIPYVNLFGFPVCPEAISPAARRGGPGNSAVCFFYDGVISGSAVSKKRGLMETMALIQEQRFASGKLYLISNRTASYTPSWKIQEPAQDQGLYGGEDPARKIRKMQGGRLPAQELGEMINEVKSRCHYPYLSDRHEVKAAISTSIGKKAGIAIRLRLDGVLQEAAVIARASGRHNLPPQTPVACQNQYRKQAARRPLHYFPQGKETGCSLFLLAPATRGEAWSCVCLILSSRLGYRQLGLRPGNPAYHP
jgi:hypothetical protein